MQASYTDHSTQQWCKTMWATLTVRERIRIKSRICRQTCEALVVPHISVGVSSLTEGVHVCRSLWQKEPARGLWKYPRNSAGEERLNVSPLFDRCWPLSCWDFVAVTQICSFCMKNNPRGSQSSTILSFLIHLIFLSKTCKSLPVITC